MGWGQPHTPTDAAELRSDIQPRDVANLIAAIQAGKMDSEVRGDAVLTLARSWQRQRRRIASLQRAPAVAYDRDVLVQVLIYHQPTSTSGCICGWDVLGASHPEHVADVYEQAWVQRGEVDGG